jgi:ABC-2 type transport system permease protein
MIDERVRVRGRSQARRESERRLSPSALRTRGITAALAAQVRSDFLQNLRMPEFLIGVVIFPVMLYLMFGLPNAGQTLPRGTSVGAFMTGSFAAYGMLAVALFAFGVDIAHERGRGWLVLMRATPVPAWVYFVAKLAVAALFASIMLALLFAVAAAFAGVRLPLERWLQLSFTLLVGGLSFSTLGFALGYWASPRGASPIANLVYLPLAFASGLFFPLRDLPEVLQRLAPYLPTYHFGQLVWQAVGSAEDIALLSGTVGGGSVTHVTWLAATFVVFGALAVIGYRRDRVRQHG